MFKAYLASRRVNDNPQGIFTKDALSDPKMPDLNEWAELKRYLMRAGQSNAIEAARSVWAGYKGKLRKTAKCKSRAM